MVEKETLTAERLREVLGYDPMTGIFTRLERPGAGRNQLGEAGAVSPAGYRIIPIDGKSYHAHRLAWLYVTGAWPSRWIKHKNGIRADNRIDNLILRPLTAVDGPGRMELSGDRLKELLEYNPETGDFIWRVTYTRAKKGNKAGVIGYYGYRYISLDGYKFVGHRLAWFYVHGVWPENRIDHINGIRDDNRIVNLREATDLQNGQNRGKTSANKSGYKGVSIHKKSGKFLSRITVNYRVISLGKFWTAEEAYDAYCIAAKEYHGEFARLD